MYWWIPMAISAASTVINTASANKQNASQKKVNAYNASNRYNTSLLNIKMQTALGGANAKMALMAGSAQAADVGRDVMFNVGQITQATNYNDLLMEQELQLMWESTGLDLEQLHMQRAREQGQIMAAQAASGTVMDMGSNRDVVVASKTQEAMDAFIIRHGADIQAAKINNSRMKSRWEAGQQINKIAWEGELQQRSIKTNAALQAGGIMLETGMNAIGGAASARMQYQSDMYNAGVQFNQNENSITNSFTTGMFSSAASGVQSYYSMKAPTVPKNDLTRAAPSASPGGSLASGSSGYTWGTGYTGNYSLIGS